MSLKRKIQLQVAIKQVEHAIDKVCDLKKNGFDVQVEPIVKSYFDLIEERYIDPLTLEEPTTSQE